MAADLSSNQRRIVDRYYENLDSIKLMKLQETVTELYLAESDAKRKQLWGRADKAMRVLAIPNNIRERIIKKQDAEVLANHLRSWLSKK